VGRSTMASECVDAFLRARRQTADRHVGLPGPRSTGMASSSSLPASICGESRMSLMIAKQGSVRIDDHVGEAALPRRDSPPGEGARPLSTMIAFIACTCGFHGSRLERKGNRIRVVCCLRASRASRVAAGAIGTCHASRLRGCARAFASRSGYREHGVESIGSVADLAVAKRGASSAIS